MQKVLIITGPTGTGKTKLSVEVAKRFKTEIINGDALQVYRGMDILTAKIKEEEKCGIKHHMFDILDPSETFSIADYQKLVRDYISDFSNNNMLPLIVGGSGLYIDSVIYDYQFSAEKRNEEELDKYSDLSNEELHNILKELNLDASNKIHMNNRKRVLRAIELAKSNNIVLDFNNKLMYDALVIYLSEDREKLYNAINNRVDKMMDEGLLDEVINLSKKDINITAASAIGYKEFLPYLNGTISLKEAIDKVKQNTRHLAKRQTTWFRNKDNIQVVKINRENFNETIDYVIDIINKWYEK